VAYATDEASDSAIPLAKARAGGLVMPPGIIPDKMMMKIGIVLGSSSLFRVTF